MRILIGVLLCVLAVELRAAGPQRNPPLTTAELLLDLARDYGLDRGGEQAPPDVLYVKTLLKAALRLDPRLTDARLLLYEFERLAGNDDLADGHLTELVSVDPGHLTAVQTWLSTNAARQQTVEQRREWLMNALAGATDNPRFAALAHLELARLALARLDRTAARMELDRALGLDAFNPDAVFLMRQILDASVPPTVRLRVGLRALERNPLAVGVSAEIGALLDDMGLPQAAERFHQHALEVARAHQASLAGPILLNAARNAYARGRLDDAIALAEDVVRNDRDSVLDAGIFLHFLLRKHNREQAAAVQEQLARIAANIRDPSDFPLHIVAFAAWYHCIVDVSPQRALALIEYAASQAPDDPFVTRVRGWALALNSQPIEAQAVVRPVAAIDPYACYLLSRLLRDGGDEASARAVVAGLTVIPAAGLERDWLDSLRFDLPDPVVIATQTGVRDLLVQFDPSVLSFHREPNKFIEATIELEDRSPMPGDPWWAVFTLSNRGKFPVTLGPDAMINPVILLSFKVEGDRPREFSDLLQITLDRQRIIPPGQAVRVRKTLDIGPLRKVSRLAPQQLLRIAVAGILDPVLVRDGKWSPAVGGQRLNPAYFNRLPANVTQGGILLTLNKLKNFDHPDALHAVELIAELVSEAQRAGLGRLNYRPDPVPLETLHQHILLALQSESWELRARSLEALQIVGLDQAILAAAERCLDDPNWVVRLMAVRLLMRQGEVFLPQLDEIARTDDDASVRDVARALYAVRSAQVVLERPAPAAPTDAAPATPARPGTP